MARVSSGELEMGQNPIQIALRAPAGALGEIELTHAEIAARHGTSEPVVDKWLGKTRVVTTARPIYELALRAASTCLERAGVPGGELSYLFVSGTSSVHLQDDRHFWVEVFVEDLGWTPFDVASATLSAQDIGAAPWSYWYFGKLDHRLVTERLPRRHLSLGWRLPPSFYLAQRLLDAPGGAGMSFHSDTGALVFSDELRFRFL